MSEMIGKWALDSVNCCDALELLAGLPDASVDAIIADPPYGLGGRNFVIDRGMRRTDNGHKRKGEYIAINESWDMDAPIDWFREAARATKDGASILIFAGKASVYKFAAVGLELGWHLVNDITWVKANPVPCFTGRQMTMATERLLWFCPSGSNWTYDSTAAKAMNDGVNLKDVWTFGIEQGNDRFHPAQKPLPLLDRCIKLFTKRGDIIVDPFMGSGTTAIACRNNGRYYIGSELNPEYVAIARDRLRLPFEPRARQADNDLSGLPLFAEQGGAE